jgi:hypothetical protein
VNAVFFGEKTVFLSYPIKKHRQYSRIFKSKDKKRNRTEWAHANAKVSSGDGLPLSPLPKGCDMEDITKVLVEDNDPLSITN